jgi:tetratricopeptide (TPR) repeat protein
MFELFLFASLIACSVVLLPAKKSAVHPGNPYTFAEADSLYNEAKWAEARSEYKILLSDTSINSAAWNRLGNCNYHLGHLDEAMENFERSLRFTTNKLLKANIYSRMAKVYVRRNQQTSAVRLLDSAYVYGYSNSDELDNLPEFKSLIGTEGFLTLRDSVYKRGYPCSADPQFRDFDFWVGHWDVHQTGSNLPVGHSVIEKIAGECAILENWTSERFSYNGKSINYFDSKNSAWEQVWVGSEGGKDYVHYFHNGHYRDKIMQFDFEEKDESGNIQKGRFSFFNLSADRVRQLQEISKDGGNSWTTVYDFTYERIK